MKKLLLLSTALVAFGAAPAHAGPAAVAWVAATLSVSATVATAIVSIGTAFASSLLASALQSTLGSKQKYSADVNFDITFGDDEPLTFIVGRYVTAGKRKYIGTWGKNHRYVTDVIEVSALPHAMLANIWVDDELGTMLTTTDTDGTGYTLGYPVTNYDDAGDDGAGHRIWVRWMDGTQTTADPMLVDLFGENEDYPWTTDMIGTGKSYAIVTTRFDDDTLTSYPNYLFEPSPLRMYDPRKDGSTGGNGSHRWGDRSTYESTANPAVIAYNIIRGIYFGDEWVFGGKNLAAWRLPRAEWVAAMNECDASVTLSGGGTERAYRCGAEITVDATAADVLEEIGKAGNMRFAEVGGRMKPLVGLPGTSVFSLTDADIVITEGQSFAPFYPISQTFNTLTATYPEPAEKWATKDAPEYQDSDSLTEDGDRYLPTSLTYGAAPFANQVQRLMRAQMRDYRRMRTHTFSLPPDAYALEPLDMVTWDSARNGYIGKQFIVESVTKAAGMNVAVSLREVDPSDYDWSTDFELPYTTVVPTNVIRWTQGISDWAAEAVTMRDNDGAGREVGIRVSCASGEVGIDRVRIQVRKSGDTNPTLDVIQAYDSPYQWTITGVAQATTYQVRGKLVSKNTAKSTWSSWITVTTDEINVTMARLAQDVLDKFDELTNWITGEGGIDGSLSALTQQLLDETETRIAQMAELATTIGAEQDARVTDAVLASSRYRNILDQVDAIRDYAANIDFAQFTANEEIRREISVQVGTLRAAFSEVINTSADDLVAIAQRVTTLETESATVQSQITEIDTSRIEGDEALANQISLLSVGTVNQFDHTAIWYFDSDVEGWIGSPDAPAIVASGYLRPAAASYVMSPTGLGIAAVTYGQVRARIRKAGSPTWTGRLYWRAAGAAWDAARSVTISAPTYQTDGTADLTFNPGWTGTVDQIRLDLTSGATASVYVEFDWIAIGRPAPGASSADLVTERTARIAADQANAASITALQAQINDATTGLPAVASAVDALETRVTSNEGAITTQSSALTALSNDLAGKASVDVIASMESQITEIQASTGNGEGIRALATQTAALRTELQIAAEEITDANARAFLAEANGRKAAAEASQTLNQKIEQTNEGLTVLAEAVTQVKATIPTLASASALSALQSTVSVQGNTISALSTSIINLSATVDGKASATALNSLTSRVDATETSIYSNSAAITSLNNQIGTKASASALNSLSSTVSQQGDDIASVSDALTSLTSTVGNFSASGKFRISTEATPSGAQSRIGLYATATNGEANGNHSAALFLEARSDGSNYAIVSADRFAVLNGSTRVVPFIIDGDNTYIRSAMIQDASITNAKMTGPIYSDNFVSGSSGWRVTRDGSAEFNDVTIRRQLAVASGSISVGDFDVGAGNTGEGSDSGSNQSWMTASKTIFLRSSGVAISAWGGAKKTYIATAGMTGGVKARLARDPDVYWGWDARVLPATRWTGDQSLRVVFTFWSRNVSSVSDCVINWKIYEVS